ncbi:MAG: GGDEF domain-containing protein, partial [Gammaproteobacteria bacterium]|nr:GGDEF domain-containing protein [Gammaproteobacteria bacterium]
NNKSITTLPGQDDTETSIYLPMLHNETVIGILMLSSNQSMENYKPIIEGLIKIYENYLFILSESEHDTLTGLLNRRSFDCRLNKLLSLQKSKDKTLNDQQGRRHAITSAPAWLIVVDVDHFKRVNDNFGHMYGDEVLLLLSQEMRKAFRQTDILFRFGGEEFVVILAPTKDEDALSVLERFRKRIANFSFPQVGQVTVSIGYAKIHDNDYPPAVLDKADKALYHAKNNGRNQVHCYETLVSNGDMIEQVTTNDVELF